MGAELQNEEAGKPAKPQTGVCLAFVKSIPVYRKYRYTLKNNQKEENDVKK
jgi:hypothetical protein